MRFSTSWATARGLTLLEILVVIAIAGGAFAGSLAFASKAMHLSARAQQTAKATVLAQNELEYWKAQDPARIRALADGLHPFANPAAVLRENQVQSANIKVRRVEAGIIEIAATVGMAAELSNPLNITLTAWLGTGE